MPSGFFPRKLRRLLAPLTVLLVPVLMAGCPQSAGAGGDDTDVTEDQAEVFANNAPVASAGDDQSVVAGDLVVLDAAASSDADNDRLLFYWRQLTAEPEITLDDAYSSRPRFNAPDVGETTSITFRVTVIDGFALSTDEVTVTVAPAEGS